MKRAAIVAIIMMLCLPALHAQTQTLSLDEAIKMGLANSKELKLAGQKIQEAVVQVEVARKKSLPTASATAGYSHALMLTRSFGLPSSDGQDPKSIEFPFDNALYQATLSINEPIYAAHKYEYAREQASLLLQLSKMDAEKNQQEVIYAIVNSYINYHTILQNLKVLQQNLDDINQKLDEIKKFESQGLATRNDVLRYELQQSEIKLQLEDLENNRQIANYSMNILLGLPDSADLRVEDISYRLDAGAGFSDFLQQAVKNRTEFRSIDYNKQLAEIDIKNIKADRMPEIGLGGSLYYINPTQPLFPKGGSYLAPFVAGLNLKWNISSLYQAKTKLAAATNRKEQVYSRESILSDEIKTEVYSAYQQYQQSISRIKVYETSVTQAEENERIMESKYKNSLATTTDRIDAQTLLYRARINVELSKASATQAYYNLLKVTGQLHP